MNQVLVLVLSLAFIIVLSLYINMCTNLKKIHNTLDGIKNNNLNGRIRIQTTNKHLKNVSNDFNHILDNFQSIQEKNYYLQMSRKKLISNISHDLRTPLTSILGFTELLQTDKNLTDEKKQSYIDTISLKSNYLYSLLEDFFELSKIDSEDMSLNLQKIDINENITEVLANFYNDFMERNITPEIRLDKGPLFVMGDNIKVNRIISNLLSNTLRYAKDFVAVRTKKDGDKVWVIIENTGKTIPEEDIPYIFDRLYTSEPSRNLKYRGSGLGLCIAKTLVEKHSGEIYVNSENNKTIVSFYLHVYNTSNKNIEKE
ncbi:signal transduction histidine kinase [Clostridium tetanomorphum]|uniref:histidine kinase n=1 Tax=Clostridium tetanomorphum TaxID=1553 RepID=A0A923E4S6_CLOTT|nr:HAMP domain-containing sensor histidine kinase [Clostridium tetanomorphum]KAJ50961.1 histidine kinase [Clostridium tetanomorphum DSM 665]MBC2396328.1 HAMP domain-containing histidine kinase [Clostridium tetanomorphum]MBP1863443.1 signal transduction histidine kinase [Clostridium tetanomorphum]NRS83540.1 signal transduction histidine kinase [Clostridium tetanomorphum]NRZ96740.1 signal transduction histidine kinase [Clostridium tetanomorphum]